MNDVYFEQRDRLGIITLSRPAALNALTHQMVRDISAHLLHWESMPEVKAVVIHSAGEKAFCAGGDIRQIVALGATQSASQLDFFRDEYQMNARIHHYPKPYIALMAGVTMGGGVGIALHGSHPVGSEHFLFAMPETGIGFFPDIGASYLLSRIPGFIGEYLALTGARLDLADALYCGLVKRYVPYEYFSAFIDALSHMDLSDDPEKAVDGCIAQFEAPRPESDLVQHLDIIQNCFSQVDVEAIMRALSAASNDWASHVHHQLSQKSPLSLKVTLAQIRQARGMRLDDCLAMDYTLVQHFIKDHDFYEGVRALLIDKDKSPRWSPAHLEAVHDTMVASYFENCGLNPFSGSVLSS